MTSDHHVVTWSRCASVTRPPNTPGEEVVALHQVVEPVEPALERLAPASPVIDRRRHVRPDASPPRRRVRRPRVASYWVGGGVWSACGGAQAAAPRGRPARASVTL